MLPALPTTHHSTQTNSSSIFPISTENDFAFLAVLHVTSPARAAAAPTARSASPAATGGSGTTVGA